MQLRLNVRLCLLALAISAIAFACEASAQDSGTPAQNETAPQAAQPAQPGSQIAEPGTGAPSTTQASSEEPRGIEADTKRLYQLALELRTEVGKTYKQSLSLAVLKKAEELEKLARSLKSEMDHEASAKKR